MPLVTRDIQEIIYSVIVKQSSDLGCKVIAISGTVHVHLLTSFSPQLAISELIQKAKGSSFHLITYEIKLHEFFQWQGGCGAFTVSYHLIIR
ncbi:transposase [Nostoc sp. UHCC 0302]|uniref:transposase n=1 Tax=Nostoc sp. UHCC 0302 TaxID=3134896 RepID=UPI00311CD79E